MCEIIFIELCYCNKLIFVLFIALLLVYIPLFARIFHFLGRPATSL